MKVNLNFTKLILESIRSNESQFFEVMSIHNDICNSNEDVKQLIFQLQIFLDEGIISRYDGRSVASLYDIGIVDNEIEPISFTDIRLRLTSKGQNYANALQNSDIFSQLKKRIKDAPINTICNIGPKLLENFAKKKLEELLK
ncbi:hypothetical protein [Pseudoalteromonas sp. S1608]|uniref:hypothetical protein n=1 Tax=Pseudoalteromonas sp. S1608 TaxID=579504 RepID=UPI00110B0C01|nr:hypothetical protein [Pseudoalteromonas sp. S1608]TMP73517.1 hypothetical protein CWB75_14160 [Pseudoalteromonas sp. S1608]